MSLMEVKMPKFEVEWALCNPENTISVEAENEEEARKKAISKISDEITICDEDIVVTGRVWESN